MESKREETMSPDTDTSENDGNIDPSVIDSIYTTMSKVIEALNGDILLLNKQLESLRIDLDFACKTIIDIKSEQQEMMYSYSTDLVGINSQINQLLESRVDDVKLANEINDIKISIQILTDKISERPAGDKEITKQLFNVRSLMLGSLQKSTKKIYEEMHSIQKQMESLNTTVKLTPQPTQLSEKVQNIETILRLFFSRYFGSNEASLLSAIESRMKKIGGESIEETYKDNETNYMYTICKVLLDIKSAIAVVDKSFID